MKRKEDLDYNTPRIGEIKRTYDASRNMLMPRRIKGITQLLCIFILNSLLYVTTRADESVCPAGYSCDLDTPYECETGWYSLEGEEICTRCPPGKLNFKYLKLFN